MEALDLAERLANAGPGDRFQVLHQPPSRIIRERVEAHSVHASVGQSRDPIGSRAEVQHREQQGARAETPEILEIRAAKDDNRILTQTVREGAHTDAAGDLQVFLERVPDP